MTATIADRGNLAKTWFYILGAALLLLALLGTFGIGHPLGGSAPPSGVSTAEPSGPVHLDGGELAVHWILGIATLGIAFFVKDAKALNGIAWAFAGVYVLVGVVGFVANVIGPWHVGTGDNVLHIVLGIASGAVAWATRDAARTDLPARHV